MLGVSFSASTNLGASLPLPPRTWPASAVADTCAYNIGGLLRRHPPLRAPTSLLADASAPIRGRRRKMVANQVASLNDAGSSAWLPGVGKPATSPLTHFTPDLSQASRRGLQQGAMAQDLSILIAYGSTQAPAPKRTQRGTRRGTGFTQGHGGQWLPQLGFTTRSRACGVLQTSCAVTSSRTSSAR